VTRARLRKLCLAQPGATSDFPFDEVTEAFRVHGRIFALLFGGASSPIEVNLKCDPVLAVDLRASHPDIVPGWHMNHEHWNTVRVDGELPDEKIAWLVAHSHGCVVSGLPRALREGLASSGEARAAKRRKK
jgi:predicted DNA-binding protein (MmcQ/YjbR family)